MHFTLGLHYPLHIRNCNGYWIIAAKDHKYNCLFSDAGVPVVFFSLADCERTFEQIKGMRKDIKYMKKIYV